MDSIGFSTGSVARSELAAALRVLQPHECGAIELSALRTHELGPLVRAIPHLQLDGYEHVSVHAPSAFTAAEEPGIAAELLPLAWGGWLVVLHPDTIHDPQASFCFDVAHAWQVDRSLRGAADMLDAFGDRLAEVHVSELDDQSRHVRLSPTGIEAYQAVADRIPLHVPVIIEAPVQPHEIADELEASMVALGRLVLCAA
jgi:hypothetical protein